MCLCTWSDIGLINLEFTQSTLIIRVINHAFLLNNVRSINMEDARESFDCGRRYIDACRSQTVVRLSTDVRSDENST